MTTVVFLGADPDIITVSFDCIESGIDASIVNLLALESFELSVFGVVAGVDLDLGSREDKEGRCGSWMVVIDSASLGPNRTAPVMMSPIINPIIDANSASLFM